MGARKLKVGDVFVVSLDATRSGVVQIVARYGKSAYYFAAFEPLACRVGLEVARAAVSGAVVLLALTFDARVWSGDWTFVANLPVSEAVPLPAYKVAVGFPPSMYVVDFSGTRRRRASDAEAANLPNRALVAPIRLEKALRALCGVEPWIEAYDELMPPVGRTSDLFA